MEIEGLTLGITFLIFSIISVNTTLVILLYRRSIPVYKPHKSIERTENYVKPTRQPAKNVSTISSERRRPKFFTDQQLLEKLNETSNRNGNEPSGITSRSDSD